MFDEIPSGWVSMSIEMNGYRAKAMEELSRGVALHRVGEAERALAYYQSAMALDPTFSDAYLNIGSALHDLKRFADALAVYDKALASRPGWGEALFNRGNTLMALDSYVDAIQSYNDSLAVMPDHVEALVTMGTALECLGRYDDAMSLYELALERSPGCAEAHWNLALSRLRLGDYANGWPEFEWRWFKKGYTTARREFACPIWDGRQLDGETVLIHAEQAFGDTLQFIRYAAPVAARGGKVLVESPQPLAPLIAETPGVSSVVGSGAELPPIAFHVPLLSLPLLFGTIVDTIPRVTPYLQVPQEKRRLWGGRIRNTDGLNVGLVWAGRPLPDPHRSCGLGNLGMLADVAGVTFYSLQVGEGIEEAASPPPGMDLVDLTGGIHDFADTAAIIERLDLVITIDTAVAHLAGGLGKPVFVLLPFCADWRWMLNRDDSPWYPTMRLFRQKQANDWQPVVEEVKEALNRFVSKRL